jgi:ketosteroid isomerase-like protein
MARIRPVVKRATPVTTTLGPRPVPDIEPDVKPEPQPEHEQEQEPISARDDVAQVKDAVFRYLALLNAGDVATRANCQLSEFTSFGMDGKPLHSSVLEWRRAGNGNTQTYDLRCRDLRVYIHKDTAIATAYLVGTVTTPEGELTRVAGRSSWVHLRQNGEWKMAHNHLSPLTPEL